jgi:hypothetical protein
MRDLFRIAAFLTFAVCAGLLFHFGEPVDAQFDGGAWKVQAAVDSVRASAVSDTCLNCPVGVADGADSLEIIETLNIKGRAVADTLIVGPCADNLLTWDIFDPTPGAPVTPCGAIYMSEDAASQDTLNITTGWTGGSFYDGHHIVIGNRHQAAAATDFAFLHIENKGGDLGIGVMDPVKDLEIAAQNIKIGQVAERTTGDLDIEYQSNTGGNTIAHLTSFSHQGNFDTQDTLAAFKIKMDGTDPNDSAEWSWHIKDESDNLLHTFMWASYQGKIVMNPDHSLARTWDKTFTLANDPDSSFEVSAGSDFKGSVNIDGKLKINNMPAAADSNSFSIGSADGSNFIGMRHNNTAAYIEWDDGPLILETQETNVIGEVLIRGDGIGHGMITIRDENDVEAEIIHDAAVMHMRTTGDLSLNSTAEGDAYCFAQAVAGETPEWKIYGYRTADALRTLNIGVGVDAANTVTFDGVGTIWLNGLISIGDAASANGHDLRVAQGAAWSEMDASEANFATSSDSALKVEKAVLSAKQIGDLRGVFADSLQIWSYKWDRDQLFSQKRVDDIWADTLKTDMQIENALRDRGPADLRSEQAVRDSVANNIWADVGEKLLADSLALDARANKLHVGMIAQQANAISRIVAPTEVEPGVIDWNHVQAAMIQLIIDQEKRIQDLEARVTALELGP